MAFPAFNEPIRTDTSFRSRVHPLHHQPLYREEPTPLERLHVDGRPFVDMVKDISTSDSLHLLDGGVMKRHVNIWMKGTSKYRHKWSSSEINDINQFIYHNNKDLPEDVNRQLRSLTYLKYYKATEFRTILLYVGIVLFKDRIPEEYYVHFLRLCLAVRLSSCQMYVKNEKLRQLARLLFSEYCYSFISLYGSDSVVSNVHLISHIADDVDRFGPLYEISAYPFENFLHDLKLRTQPSDTPLEQIARRIIELTNHQPNILLDFEKRNFIPELRYEFKVDSGIHSGQLAYKYIKIGPNTFLSMRKKGDSWLITEQKQIVKMKFAVKRHDSYFIYGAELIQKTDFFTQPYSSHFTDIYSSNGKAHPDKLYNVKDIRAKMMCLTYNDEIVLIPILHSLDELNKEPNKL